MEFDYAIKGNFYQQCDYLLKHLKNWKNCELRTLNSRILFIHVEFITYPRLEPYQKRISDLNLMFTTKILKIFIQEQHIMNRSEIKLHIIKLYQILKDLIKKNDRIIISHIVFICIMENRNPN